jgi:TRAP-type C4-dicarboxylate transport system substrate-binding protein
MWDGFWFLGNRRAWEALPADIRAVITKHINAAGVAERADVAVLDKQLKEKLAAAGMVFNDTPANPVRDTLRKAGFYTEWKGKYGDKAWALLEQSVGKLS